MKENTNTLKIEIKRPEYAQSCLVCGKTIATYDFPVRKDEVCEDCKKAVAYAKKLMEKEKIDLIKSSRFTPTIENDEIKSIDIITSTVISKEDDPYMNNTSILKPCPFCGDEARIVEECDCMIGENVYFIECCSCRATFYNGDVDKSKEIEKWNRRV